MRTAYLRSWGFLISLPLIILPLAGPRLEKKTLFLMVPLGMLGQIQSFAAGNPSFEEGTLFVLWAGLNNFLDPDFNPNTLIGEALEDIGQGVGILASLGATQIVVAGVPSVGNLPFAIQLNLTEELQNLSFGFNVGLQELLAGLSEQFPNLNLIFVDTLGPQLGVIGEPSLLALTNVTDPCLQNNVVCETPDQFLYWDEIHFTSVFHTLLTSVFFDSICNSPQAFTNCQPNDL